MQVVLYIEHAYSWLLANTNYPNYLQGYILLYIDTIINIPNYLQC